MWTCSLPMTPAIDDRLTIDPPSLAIMACSAAIWMGKRDNQDGNPGSRHWHDCRGVTVAQGGLRICIVARIASPGMFPEAETLPHLICSRPMFIGGANDEADQHG